MPCPDNFPTCPLTPLAAPPRLLHYGLHWTIKEWEFDKHWYYDFDIYKCPPWDLSPKRPMAGLFPIPPHPSKLKQTEWIQYYKDILASEAIITLNSGLCEWHERRCPNKEAVRAVCDPVRAQEKDLAEAIAKAEADFSCHDHFVSGQRLRCLSSCGGVCWLACAAVTAVMPLPAPCNAAWHKAWVRAAAVHAPAPQPQARSCVQLTRMLACTRSHTCWHAHTRTYAHMPLCHCPPPAGGLCRVGRCRRVRQEQGLHGRALPSVLQPLRAQGHHQPGGC
jgi:hypothetical protein